jgi:transposase-like protein
MKAVNTSITLLEVIRVYADEQAAFEAAKIWRWPDGNVVCPRCECERVHYIQTRRVWRCNGCKRQFSVKVSTIFEDSPISFTKWIPAMWMIANCKNGISSYELHRALGVTQKTAWFMLHRIRLAMQDDLMESSGGHIEIDETPVGGKARNMHKHEKPGQRGVVGKQPAWTSWTVPLGKLRTFPQSGTYGPGVHGGDH